MSFKDIYYLELWWPFCSAEQNHLFIFGRGYHEEQFWYHEEQFCEIILNLDHWLRIRCRSKDFLCEALGQPSWSVEWNHLCNFGKGHYGEHSCEGIINLDQLFRRCRLKKKFTDVRQTKTDHNSSITLSLRVR